MKLMIAIVHDDDADELIERINEGGYGVTKLATTGGFLKSGNTTLLIGLSPEKVEEVVSLIKETCHTRREIISPPSPVLGATGVYVPSPVEITIGGATVFVIDVDRFEKV